MEIQDYKNNEIDYILYYTEGITKSIGDEFYNKRIDYNTALLQIKEMSEHLNKLIINLESIK
jgi:hypothetical protein